MASSLSRSGFAGPLTSEFTPPADCTNFALVTQTYTTIDSNTVGTATDAYDQTTYSRPILSTFTTVRTELNAMPFHGRCDEPRSKNTCLPSGNAGVLSPAFMCPVGFTSVLMIQPVTGAQYHHVYVSGLGYTVTPDNLLVTAVPTTTMLPEETAILCCPM
jgi:hypothetical protein